MVQPSARPIMTLLRTTSSLSTGSVPGWPMHTGHTCVLGAAPYSDLHLPSDSQQSNSQHPRRQTVNTPPPPLLRTQTGRAETMEPSGGSNVPRHVTAARMQPR